MNICLSSGTGSGKSTLLEKLGTISGYVINSETTSTLLSNSTINANIDLYTKCIEHIVDLESTDTKYILDRSPVDYLVGSLLLGEISLIEAYHYLDAFCDAVRKPLTILVVPVPSPVICMKVVHQKESRVRFWEKVFSLPIDDGNCNVYKGMTIAHTILVDFYDYVSRYSDCITYVAVEPTQESNYYSWTHTAIKHINMQIK